MTYFRGLDESPSSTSMDRMYPKSKPNETLTRTERVEVVVSWLRPIAAPVADEAEYSRWISARNGADPDQSEDWCHECASAEVSRLNAAHPEHEYFVDGGLGSTTDCPPYCWKCGKSLDDPLSEYGIRDEVEHYSLHSVSLRGEEGAERAFRFIQAFSSHAFDVNDKRMWQLFRKVERMCARRARRTDHAHTMPQQSS
jgi:hypothetical protein